MRPQTTLSGLVKATCLGIAVALFTCYGFLAYIRWGQGLPLFARMLALAAGGSLSLTCTAGVIFSVETGASMRRMPILRIYGLFFFSLMLMLTIKIVLDRLF